LSGTGQERPFGESSYHLVSQVQPHFVSLAGRSGSSLDAGSDLDGPDGGPARGDAEDDAESSARSEPFGDTDDERAPDLSKLRRLNVVTLGGPGVGKTNLMAAMYATLSKPDAARGYQLFCENPNQRGLLNRFARQVRDPGGWPERTEGVELRQYEFICTVPVAGEPLPVLRICYWDYPGEALLGTADDLDSLRDSLRHKIEEAHAVIIVVDGVQLREAETDNDEWNELTETLTACEEWATTARCPVQIVVTKWDAVGGYPDSSGRPWDRGRAIQALRDYPVAPLFLSQRHRTGSSYRGHGPRVIPVSVTGGPGSTEPEGRNWKRLVPAVPVNVDVPFAGILPDRLGQVFADLGTAALERRLKYAKRRIAFGMIKTGARILALVLKIIALFPLLRAVGGVAGAIMEQVATFEPGSWTAPFVLDRSAKRRGKARQRKEDKRLVANAKRLRKEASRSDAARFEVLMAFSNRLAAFEAQYPAAKPAPNDTTGRKYL
jgi:hypothetical protein